MKEFNRTILRMVWLVSISPFTLLGFIIGLVVDAFQAGISLAKDFVWWI